VSAAEAWVLEYTEHRPAEEGQREALCTLANGLFGTRGAAPEACADGTHYPGTYVAGLFDRLVTHIEGRDVENEDMVNVPNWLPLTFRIDDGAWFDLAGVEVLELRQTLELRRGVLVRRIRFRDGEGRETTLAQRRIVHLARPHVAALETSVRADNWSGTLTVRTSLDGSVRNTGVARYRALADRHLEVLEAGPGPGADVVVLRARTVQSRIEVAEAARTRVWVDDEPVEPVRRPWSVDDQVGQELEVDLARGSACRLEKVVTLFTGRDVAISEPGLAAVDELERAPGFGALLDEHVLAWEQQWRRFAIRVDGADWAAQPLNLHLFHLLQVAAPGSQDLDVGIPARGLHGEAYRGHIFWDEIFIFPLLNHRVPAIARSLLRYRYRRLPAARAAARRAGLEGAMFPWQSGSDGREESQSLHLNPASGRWLPDDSHRQRHIASAIAHNVWQYVEVTNDVDFLAEAGGELMVEIARLWASMAAYDEVDDRYDIHHVVGPDEFHDHDPHWEGPGLRNNTYTNVKASWVLARGERLLERLPALQRDALLDRMQLQRGELERWDHISRRLRIPVHEDGVVSQFEGYEALEELDWDGYRERYGDIHRLDRILEAEGDDVTRYKASKQADVLMLAYVFSFEELSSLYGRLGHRYDADALHRDIDYYCRRTSHGSTLSQVVHSWVLARSDRAASLELFRTALDADINDVQGGTTAEGIHLGAMAGTVDLAERGYSGMEVVDGLLRFRPRLPEGIDGVEFRIYHRQRWINVAVADHRLVLTSEPTTRGPVRVAHRDEVTELHSGETLEFHWNGATGAASV
jgi:alpha,alpha-trehalase